MVILAILAAILVPALLGWIDKAKEKQLVLNARSAYMAAQTLASEEYGKAAPNRDANVTKAKVYELADLDGTTCSFSWKYVGTTDKTKRSYYEVRPKYYIEGGVKITYTDNNEWVKDDDDTPSPSPSPSK